jgi:hypothetical protein
LAVTLSEKKKSGYGILGQCREPKFAQNGTARHEQIDFMTAVGVMWEIGGPTNGQAQNSLAYSQVTTWCGYIPS